jgi:hypothetical protein
MEIIEEFEINLVGQILTVQALADETYNIFEGQDLLCNIHPVESVDLGVEWRSNDLVEQEWVKQVGELIEEHNL